MECQCVFRLEGVNTVSALRRGCSLQNLNVIVSLVTDDYIDFFYGRRLRRCQ